MKKISLAHRRLLVVVALAVLLIAATAPPVSANEYPYSENISYSKSIVEYYDLSKSVGTSGNSYAMYINDIETITDLKQIVITDLYPSHVSNPNEYPSGKTTFSLGDYGYGDLYYSVKFVDGVADSVQCWFDFTEWSPSGTGDIRVPISYNATDFAFSFGSDWHYNSTMPNEPGSAFIICGYVNQFGNWQEIYGSKCGIYYVYQKKQFEHYLIVDEYDNFYQIKLDKLGYYSSVDIIDDENVVHYSQPFNNVNIDYNLYKLPIKPPVKFNITDKYNNYYEYIIVGQSIEEPDNLDAATVTVYVKNSQTGAAIANSNVVIDALVNGEYYPVVNETEPSGIFSITLQPTGGGQPNPDGYRLIATADGYNNPMPEINFTVTDSKKYIYCYLDPISGGPENENNTFIDFYVRDLSANPVSGATVKFGKYTLITNSHGYTVFEVPKNIDYTYTVSKSGYGPVTGNANIGANNRYIINAVIGPAVTPTKPTPIPTSTSVTPTPTMTAPTGEPVGNWLEWFAAHFGMILGGGVEIGKIFMWLCFTVPVGVYVGKESKAGAAGFMAGAGIVTLFFVLIGWVPMWLVVLLALIIGLLYAKEFNNPNNGGGR